MWYNYKNNIKHNKLNKLINTWKAWTFNKSYKIQFTCNLFRTFSKTLLAFIIKSLMDACWETCGCIVR